MGKSERVFNVVAGLSALSWAVLGLLAAAASDRVTLIRVAITLLNLFVGLLFLIRAPLLKPGSLQSALVCFPSLLTSGLAFKLSPLSHLWPIYAEIIFITGATLTLTSLLYLGRYFAIFPALRGITGRGPYHLVRHPAYAGELLMVTACLLANLRSISILLFMVVLPGLVVRIRVEEKLLEGEAAYRQYARKVPWRLLPGVW